MFTVTYDVKRRIEGLACNKYDTQIAIIENDDVFYKCDQSCVRLYDVGKKPDDDYKFWIRSHLEDPADFVDDDF